MNKKIFAFFLILSVSLLNFYLARVTEGYTASELLQLTRESLNADWQNNTAYVRGVGRISQDDAQGLLLARRAALTDARRGLLFLREKILSSEYKQNLKSSRLSGYVPPLRILSETIDDELYFVEVEADLSLLISKDGKTYLSNIYKLKLEED